MAAAAAAAEVGAAGRTDPLRTASKTAEEAHGRTAGVTIKGKTRVLYRENICSRPRSQLTMEGVPLK